MYALLTHFQALQVYLSGMVAGAVQAAITTPSDLLKIRMQLQPHAPGSPSFIGARRMLQNVVQAEGVRGECPQPCLTQVQHVLYRCALQRHQGSG